MGDHDPREHELPSITPGTDVSGLEGVADRASPSRPDAPGGTTADDADPDRAAGEATLADDRPSTAAETSRPDADDTPTIASGVPDRRTGATDVGPAPAPRAKPTIP